MLSAAVKNKIEQIWLDVIAGGVSQPTEVIEQLTYRNCDCIIIRSGAN